MNGTCHDAHFAKPSCFRVVQNIHLEAAFTVVTEDSGCIFLDSGSQMTGTRGSHGLMLPSPGRPQPCVFERIVGCCNLWQDGGPDGGER